MEAVDDGHLFHLAYLRNHYETHMHNGRDTFALDVVRNGPRRNDRDRDNIRSNRDNSKTARLARGAMAPQTTFAKDTTKNYGKGKTKADGLTTDNGE
eukprot:jgi/Tetstr1/436587/TSEL_025384.t1